MSAALGGGLGGDKGLRMPLLETLRLAWADPELKAKILFVLAMFGVFALGVNVPVPIPGVSPERLADAMKNIPFFQLADLFGGGALRKVSIFALGLNPYITASIIMQILTTAMPQWKKEMQEGGEYARRQQNRRTRFLTIFLCIAQAMGLIQILRQYDAIPGTATWWVTATIVIFWTAGAMFMLWLGEQISEKGIGNGVSLMIFAGIILSMPYQVGTLVQLVSDDPGRIVGATLLILIFLATTWLIVLFTTAQRRIPIQHMRRQIGTRMMGGQTSYLPLSVNMAGVIPIIFAVSLVMMPGQFAAMFPIGSTMNTVLNTIGEYLNPMSSFPQNIVAYVLYTLLIFFFTYFYTAIQYNVEDMSNNLKRHGSFIPGVRPGKQTKDFLDGVISRITVVGAFFLAFVALVQYLAWGITDIQGVSIVGGTSLLIMVSVALETMRQIEANLLMKKYGA
ncbi:MAG TPA: preprotein translocase subunit SecY [Fimbriimonadaceae bacterium]|nr:preprotein translocase subunit SecY [Fimbriimonadaceae bacterium]